MFAEMGKAARSWLAGKDPWELAEQTGMTFHGTAFQWNCLGTEIALRYPDYEADPPLPHWLLLVVLHYLNLADGTPLTGQWISFARQKDGMIRGGGFDRAFEDYVRDSLGRLPMEELQRKCRALGGEEAEGSADVSVIFHPLPRYPVKMNLWLADEEFPASGRLLLDHSAERYLTIEDSVALGESLVELLRQA